MIFDERGLPRDNGATDMLDSSRLAGLMSVFGYDGILFWQYFDLDGSMFRHPEQGVRQDFSRDQMVCLLAGVYFDWKRKPYAEHPMYADYWSKLRLAPNGDLLSPSVRNHLRLCAGKKGSRLGYWWLKLDIWWNKHVQPMSEPNQLICMMMVAGPEYVRLWKQDNENWAWAIRKYWCNWRDEAQLAEYIIEVLERT